MKNSHIEWTDHTFNPWIGCTKVSPGCAHCYAESLNKRWKAGANWGKGALRSRTSAANWRQPIQWNKDARDAHARPRVFCASLADWLDDEVPIEWLADLLQLIHDTPFLDWLLLTKRPENWSERLTMAMAHVDKPWRDEKVPERPKLGDWIGGWIEAMYPLRGMASTPANVWIGTSVEDQVRLDQRVPLLLNIPAHVRFLSCEPLLGPLNLRARPSRDLCIRCGKGPEAHHDHPDGYRTRGLDWIICGGESGPGARPMHPAWAESLRDQCTAARVPFFFKQWGEWYPLATNRLVGFDSNLCVVTYDGSPYNRTTLVPENGQVMIRDGKRVAGRRLNARTWDEFPKTEVPCPR